MRVVFSLCLGLIFATNQAVAHHSFAASFIDERIETQGVVERYIFKNPHVIIYLNVTDQEGNDTRWMVEGAAATSFRSSGWSNETIVPGEYVHVSGRAGRDGKPMISLESIEVLDPVTHAVLRSPPVRRGFDESAAEVVASIPLTLEDGRPNLTGDWGRGRGGPGFRNHREPPFNEAGIALQALWDPADDPQVACENPSLPRQGGYTPHPVRIEQLDDHVAISYEEYGGVRTIYFDGRDAGSRLVYWASEPQYPTTGRRGRGLPV